MLVPVALVVPEGPPTPLQLKLLPYIRVVVCSQAVVAVCRAIVGDIWGCISDLLVVALGYFALRESNIMYLMWYGVACFFNSLFDMIRVVARLIKFKDDYFDSDMEVTHNIHSFAILAAVVLAGLGAAMSYSVFRDYGREYGFGDAVPYAAQAPNYGAAGGYYSAPRPAANTAGASNFAAFSGAGHRLDGGDPTEYNFPPPQRSAQRW
mmetsp:Transcript_51660/g.82067  ORF Transcript_51660/g.82067 Transcript_51660/m.82067 type:complete len:208 (-) Transcript_51660:116-739(-)|eukprot:CAMPEP_0169066108 /NCGR_PEP_ID=MMETSP1015-20121227/2775_1 /TAXON_ID=342587 /ORGANISM="Karlodinium micrum, Strain CCMP2283" /LENGTH=207 /DNA_ID=CAMNT_0009124755 /DNA_START=100 /DNA_END=723 /DNA_ORIENTATION=-